MCKMIVMLLVNGLAQVPEIFRFQMGIVRRNANFRKKEKKKGGPRKRNWQYKKEGEKGSTSFSSTLTTHETQSAFTCVYFPCWSCNCEHSHSLLHLQAGTRLEVECSHSYTLLRDVSAKKKINVIKVSKANK